MTTLTHRPMPTLTHRPMPTLTQADLDRFFAKVPEAPRGRCQVMDSCDTGHGYRTISIQGRSYQAHRVAYFIAYGTDPGEMTVEHTCANKGCMRPSHLMLLTRVDNVLAPTSDCQGALNARKDACHRGHEFTAENTRIQIDAKGRSARVCRTCERARNEAKRRAAGMKPRQPAAPKPEPRGPVTECKNGHAFDEVNTRVDVRKDGSVKRACRACEKARSTARRAPKSTTLSDLVTFGEALRARAIEQGLSIEQALAAHLQSA